jgi:hypothetical protein
MTEEGKVNIKVKGQRQSKIKEPTEKTNKTAFLFTVSTNQRYADSDPHLESDEEFFEDVIADICNNLPKYVIIKEEGKPWNTQTIKDVDVTYTVERGKTGQLHAHILFKIKHTTKVHLDYTAIRKKLCDELGLDNVFASNKLLRGGGVWSDSFLQDYLSKPRYT